MSADQSQRPDGSSYGQILRSSALIGGSQALIVVVNVIRTKVMALLLGPAGYGLMSVYTSIADLASSVGSLGVDRSGVRQIAVSAGSGDSTQIALTAAVLRRVCLVLGLLGAALLVGLSPFVSKLTFEDPSHASAIALLSLAVMCKIITGGQSALVQGLRRVGDLAMLGVVGAVGGSIVSLLIIYMMGLRGVAPALVGVAAAALYVSWWYSRRVQVDRSALVPGVFQRESLALVKLGFAFMASGFLMLGASYAVRTMIIRHDDLQAAGYYQAAWALGGLYVSTILQAMGADFYPRLSGAISDNTTVNRLVNEQTHVSLLLAGPGVIATLAFSPLLLRLFYTADFVAAAGMLHWICLGMTLRIVTWPIGFIIVAQGRQTIFFATELAWAVFNVVLSWICIQNFGLLGAGIAFMLSYVLHWCMIYPIVRHLTGFRWTATNIRTGSVYLAIIATVFGAAQLLPPWPALFVGIAAFAVTAWYSLYSLTALIPAERLPRRLRVLAEVVAGRRRR